MNLYFLRHAIALDRTQWKRSDSDRPLTEDGIRKMKKAAKGIKGLDLELDAVLTSPFRRAFDTAKLVTAELKIEKKLKVSRSLTPDGDPKALLRHLALDYRSWESVMLVGHEPYLTSLIGILIGGLSGIALELRRGGLCKLTADSLTYGRCASLQWFISPKILRTLA